SGEELGTVAIDSTGSFNSHVLSIRRRDHDNVAVTRRYAVTSMIVLDRRTTQQTSLRRDMQGDVALQLDGADDKSTRRNQHRPSLFTITHIDGGLDHACVQCLTVPQRAKITDVIDTGAAKFLISCRLSAKLFRCYLWRTKHCHSQRGRKGRDRQMGKQFPARDVAALLHLGSFGVLAGDLNETCF